MLGSPWVPPPAVGAGVSLWRSPGPGKTRHLPPGWRSKSDRITVRTTALIRHRAAWKQPWSSSDLHSGCYLLPFPAVTPFNPLVPHSYTACPGCLYPSGPAVAVLISTHTPPPMVWVWVFLYLLNSFLDNPPYQSANSQCYYLQDLTIPHTDILLLEP